MLRFFFPSSGEGAELYGGFLQNDGLFFKTFDAKENLVELLLVVNDFLDKNGYNSIDINEIDIEDFNYEKHPVSLSFHDFSEQFVLFIERDQFTKPQTSFLINELKKFRDDREWEQFHNPKDLSIALSIESNELLEQFLWKNHEDANRDKIKEELADVFAYALLLADKLNLDVEKIVLEKIKSNAKKYPVEKAKGNAKKYNEL